MSEYQAKLDFQTVAVCKKALEVYKSVLETLSGSGFNLDRNTEYKEVCEAYEKILSKL